MREFLCAWISLGLSFRFILTVGLCGGNRKAEGCFELFVMVVGWMKGLSGQGEQRDVEKIFEYGDVRLSYRCGNWNSWPSR